MPSPAKDSERFTQGVSLSMKLWQASMILVGVWVAVALASCGVGGEEGKSESLSAPAVVPTGPSSVSSGSSSAPSPAARVDAVAVSLDRQVAGETGEPSAESDGADGEDEEEAAAIALLIRQ